jgi:uncharacterized NAD(P)/FAD-binding protein YdhS
MPDHTILIAGGGASGMLLAANAVRASANARVVIIEPREQLGRGMAYSTIYPEHLLNVPAGRMSAFVNDPEHFVRFLEQRDDDRSSASSFVQRRIYGDYLEWIARETSDTAGARWQHVRARAVDAALDERGVNVVCDDGSTLRGDALVLATGNAAPAPWSGAIPHGQGAERWFASAWDEHALAPLEPMADVLLLGTGLTAIDAVLALRHNGHRGTIYMVSRRGLLPHEHRLFDAPPQANPQAESMHDLFGAVRAVARRPAGTWRASIDGLRSRTNSLWQALSVNDQRRFLRHMMPYWNVHRHRMAPEVAKSIADAISSGWLRMLAGRTGKIVATQQGLRVPIRLRGEERTIELEVGRAINCSGPAHDVRALADPLIARLIAQGIMRPSGLGIGADIASNGALRDAGGIDSRRVFAIGPVRFGTLIETTAMPEIRSQAKELAELLLAGFDACMSLV